MRTERARTTAERRRLRSVALPSEHGGWGLTLEPVLLGSLVAPSWAGLCIGGATLLAFLVRTPLKLALVDRRRGRRLPRSRLAVRLVAVEGLAIGVLVAAATWLSGWAWWLPVVVALPLVAIELWYDVRSRSRRLVPELAGAIGIAAAAAAVIVAGGDSSSFAAAAWMVLAGRAVGSIPFVRSQIARLRGSVTHRSSDLAQAAAVAIGFSAALVDRRVVLGAVALVVIAGLHVGWARRAPSSVQVVGVTQMGIGLGLVVATAAGAAIW